MTSRLLRAAARAESASPSQGGGGNTRIAWKLGRDREKVKFAMAIYAGVIREVYEVMGWFPEGSTFQSLPNRNPPEPGRWEFVGRVAEDKVRKKYLYRSVAHYFPKASQNPIQYVNME